MPMRACLLVSVAALVVLSGCVNAVPAPHTRTQSIVDMAQSQGWAPRTQRTGGAFDLMAFEARARKTSDRLIIFIEGDGFAWRSRTLMSDNPTPINPTALDMAMRQSAAVEANVVYLGRPCQYVALEGQNLCTRAYWGQKRFAPEVVQATNAAIDDLKARYGAADIVLAGYSGGGALAALVAAGRADVAKLVSIAGNMDTALWADMHHITPLDGSQNPADYAGALKTVEQVLYVGADDKVMPEAVARAYAARFDDGAAPQIIVIKGASHHSGWPAIFDQIN